MLGAVVGMQRTQRRKICVVEETCDIWSIWHHSGRVNTLTPSLMPAASFQTAEQAFRQIQNIVDFSSNVMSILLGEKFVHSGVSSSWLLTLVTMTWSLSGCLLSITAEDWCLLLFDCCWWMLSSSSNLVWLCSSQQSRRAFTHLEQPKPTELCPKFLDFVRNLESLQSSGGLRQQEPSCRSSRISLCCPRELQPSTVHDRLHDFLRLSSSRSSIMVS